MIGNQEKCRECRGSFWVFLNADLRKEILKSREGLLI